MKYNENKTFSGVMDFDSDYLYVEPGDYGVTYNCRSGGSGESNLGGLKNIPGTKLDESVSYAGVGGDIARTLGSVEWLSENSVIFAVYTTSGGGSFIQYSLLDQSVTKVIFQDAKLDWDENGFVDMQIIGDYLIWTHTDKSPGAIKIQNAITTLNTKTNWKTKQRIMEKHDWEPCLLSLYGSFQKMRDVGIDLNESAYWFINNYGKNLTAQYMYQALIHAVAKKGLLCVVNFYYILPEEEICFERKGDQVCVNYKDKEYLKI